MKADFYVYVYLDPRKPGLYEYGNLKFTYEPFYVGKGRAYRCYTGLGDGKKKKSMKATKITAIKNAGYMPIVLKIKEMVIEQVSLDYEISVIEQIGRSETNNGPLTNHTNGGEGMSGWNHKTEWRMQLSKPVLQLNLTNGETIAEFASIKNAAAVCDLFAQNIGNVVNGKANSSGGFGWRYKHAASVLQAHLSLPAVMPKHSESTIAKMSGIKRDSSTKEKMRAVSPNKKAIKQYDKSGLVLLAEWPSMQDASRATGLPTANLTSCCKGRIKSCGGFVWYYVEHD